MLGAKNVALTDPCNASIFIQHDLRKILSKNLKIQILTDSETLFNVIIRNAFTTGRMLMIDTNTEREAYNKGIVNHYIWTGREYNMADSYE